jgi:hypothetical protein
MAALTASRNYSASFLKNQKKKEMNQKKEPRKRKQPEPTVPEPPQGLL